ncbi:MAG: hypothetical protein ACXVHL_28215 [Solirubrobacteraceae bacterium]
MSGSGCTAIYGPEPWKHEGDAVWSYWDLWFCVVAVADHDGALDLLADAITDGGRAFLSTTVEAKLSHLDDLRGRLAAAGLYACALVGDMDADPRVCAKARTKVLKQGLYPRDLTDAMRYTPRERLYERALLGHWPLFRASPQPFYERLVNELGDSYLPKGATFRLARRLDAARDRLDAKTTKEPAARLAARRALVSFCYRAMERCDDSYGEIGEIAREALLVYAKLPFHVAGIAGEVWCEDVCELLVSEDWGLLHRHETKPFAQVHGALAEHAERFLLELADELKANRLHYQAQEALQNVAYLHIAAGRLTRFAEVAARLGSDHWVPIVSLAEAAITRERRDVARAVFAAADRPGLQRDYLHERCIELTGQPPSR